MRLYLWNAELCAALYLPIQGLEVVLRNALHDELAKVNGPDWFHHGGVPLAYVQAAIVQEIQGRLLKQRKAVTPASMVAELSLGFWVALLGKDYDATLWRACLYKAFINRPQPFQRKHIPRSTYPSRRFYPIFSHVNSVDPAAQLYRMRLRFRLGCASSPDDRSA